MPASTNDARVPQLFNIGQPKVGDWRNSTDVLHWAVRAMRPEHPAFSFMAGLLSYFLEFGTLTERQSACAVRIVRELRAEMFAEFGA